MNTTKRLTGYQIKAYIRLKFDEAMAQTNPDEIDRIQKEVVNFVKEHAEGTTLVEAIDIINTLANPDVMLENNMPLFFGIN